MSGHNKWSKIKHKKGASDAQRSKIFSKHSTLITMEVKKSGGDVNSAGVLVPPCQLRSVKLNVGVLWRLFKLMFAVCRGSP